jgi:hypothetical protein
VRAGIFTEEDQPGRIDPDLGAAAPDERERGA